ncbi:MAG: crossover junction endodeoxyribonuclease RuvC [Deltaproteobacteria bacterium]|nr:crossover junction endodeoxyribonuclease RuvC [Deltaproteobacteria bacterium]
MSSFSQGSDPSVLGVDPGSRKFGWAVVRQRGKTLERMAGGVVRMHGDLHARLGEILQKVQALMADQPVCALAVESAFVQKNARTALVLGQARGLPIAVAAARGLPVFEYPPATVKRAVAGSGRADKHQMRHMIAATLGLATLPAEDEADALAIAVTHLRHQAFASQLAPQARPVATVVAAEPTPTPARAAYLAAVAQARAMRRAR